MGRARCVSLRPPHRAAVHSYIDAHDIPSQVLGTRNDGIIVVQLRTSQKPYLAYFHLSQVWKMNHYIRTPMLDRRGVGVGLRRMRTLLALPQWPYTREMHAPL